VGAAASKSIGLGLIILATSALVVAAAHRATRSGCSRSFVLTAVSFSLFGFIIGILGPTASTQLQVVVRC